MKLKIDDENEYTKHFWELNPTDLFRVISTDMDYADTEALYHGVFMKLENKALISSNSVRLNDGKLFHINENMILRSVSGELYIL